jgi:hypothetical protein
MTRYVAKIFGPVCYVDHFTGRLAKMWAGGGAGAVWDPPRAPPGSGLATGASPARAGSDRLNSIKSTSCQLRVSILGKAVDCTSVAGIGYVQANMAGPGPGWAGSRARAWDGSGRAGPLHWPEPHIGAGSCSC